LLPVQVLQAEPGPMVMAVAICLPLTKNLNGGADGKNPEMMPPKNEEDVT